MGETTDWKTGGIRRRSHHPDEAETRARKAENQTPPEQSAAESRMLGTQVRQLQSALAEKEAALSKYSDLFDFAPVSLFLLNSGYFVSEVNLAGAHLLGAKRHMLLKKPFLSFVAIDSRNDFESYMHELFSTGTRHSIELMLLRNREAPIHVYLKGIAAESRQDEGKGYLLSAIDITRRKQQEEETARSNRNLGDLLRQKTSEIESFSYAVAHDLREPLRHIEMFTKELMQDYGVLDSRGKDYFNRIRNATSRISALSNSLLQLSRVTASELTVGEVDLSAVAQSVATTLRADSPDRRAEFVIANQLKTQGDASLLRIVLENLLGNAWKFTADRHAAVIEFGASRTKKQTVYFVRDNGPGFDMAFSRTLFTPFHRFHQRTGNAGLGIGLATAKRVIELHGGQIWAESELDKGAAFYFTVPGKNGTEDTDRHNPG